MNRLSHSAAQKYNLCGEAYRLHYVEKLREKITSAALLFGTAIDEALNVLLIDSNLQKAKDTFNQHWALGLINNKPTLLTEATNVVFAAADFDREILDKDDQAKIESRATQLGFANWQADFDAVTEKKSKSGKNSLSENENLLWVYANWVSLRRKGLLMLDAYDKHIRPRIKKVIAVQKKTEISSSDGDSIVMVIDLIAEWEDGSTIVIDHKTAARRYEDDAVISKPQLSLYTYKMKQELNNPNIKSSYIVFIKNISKNRTKVCSVCSFDGTGARHKTCSNVVEGKRCGAEWMETLRPEAEVQVLIDTIPDRVINMVMDNFDAVNHAIHSKIFIKNLNSCGNMFGGKCPYFQKCWYGKEDGLERME